MSSSSSLRGSLAIGCWLLESLFERNNDRHWELRIDRNCICHNHRTHWTNHWFQIAIFIEFEFVCFFYYFFFFWVDHDWNALTHDSLSIDSARRYFVNLSYNFSFPSFSSFRSSLFASLIQFSWFVWFWTVLLWSLRL